MGARLIVGARDEPCVSAWESAQRGARGELVAVPRIGLRAARGILLADGSSSF
jgi:hypothetical protein